jgi:tetratricopeptide (TPR) repeat protein
MCKNPQLIDAWPYTSTENGPRRLSSLLLPARLLVGVVLLPFAASPVLGQLVQKYDRVTVVARRAELKVGARVVGTLPRGETCTVGEIKDGWYWVSKNDIRGWIRASDAMLRDRAIRFLSEAIRHEPAAENYNVRGQLWSWKGRHDLAIADFTEAIRLAPMQATFYRERGLQWYLLRQLDKAIADYGEAIRRDSKNPAYLALRANSWHEIGDNDRAIADYGAAIRLRPDDADMHLKRGRLWGRKGDYDRAIADYDDAIRIDPRNDFALVNRAGVRLERGDQEGAMKDYDEAIRLTAEDPWIRDIYHGVRAAAWSKLGRYDRALADLKEASRLNPRQAGAYSGLAWILATCPDARYRDGAKAVEYATKAVELSRSEGPDRAAILAAAYAEARDFVRAIQWQKKAIAAAPEGEGKKLLDALKLYEKASPYRQQGPDDPGQPEITFDTFIQ